MLNVSLFPCRVLYGQLHVIGYDWVNRQQHTAQLAADSSLIVDDVAILGPDYGGNMHCLTAVTDVAILDVLAPAYDPKGGKLATANEWLAHGKCFLHQFAASVMSTRQTSMAFMLQAETAHTMLSFRTKRQNWRQVLLQCCTLVQSQFQLSTGRPWRELLLCVRRKPSRLMISTW
jgi:PCO_ADO